MSEREKLRKVFEAIDQLDEESKSYLMGYLAMPLDMDRLNQKVKAFLRSK